MISGNICVKFLSISDLRISSNKTDINTQESEQYNSTGTPEHIKVSKILCLMFAWRWEKLLKCCCICQVSVFWWYQLKVNRQRSKNCWTISTTSLCCEILPSCVDWQIFNCSPALSDQKIYNIYDNSGDFCKYFVKNQINISNLNNLGLTNHKLSVWKSLDMVIFLTTLHICLIDGCWLVNIVRRQQSGCDAGC